MVSVLLKMPLRARNGTIRAWTSLDIGDYERFGHLRWSLQRGRYAGRMKDRKIVYLHRAIMGLDFGDPRQVDHINHDKLDNRRANLRIVTNAQNKQNLKLAANNTSGYRGVWFNKNDQRWCADVWVGGKRWRKTYFKTPEEASNWAEMLRESFMGGFT